MKRFTITVPYENEEGKSDTFPFHVYIGNHPEVLRIDPLLWQSTWLDRMRGYRIPDDVADSFCRLLIISRENHCDLEDLCVYALGDPKKAKNKYDKSKKKSNEELWSAHLSWLKQRDSVFREYKVHQPKLKAKKRIPITESITLAFDEIEGFAKELAQVILPKDAAFTNQVRVVLSHVIIVHLITLCNQANKCLSDKLYGIFVDEKLNTLSDSSRFHEDYIYNNAVILDVIAAILPAETLAVIQSHTMLWDAGEIITETMRKAVVDWLKKPYKGSRKEIGALWKEMKACQA